MKSFFTLTIILLVTLTCEGLKNYSGTDLQKCLNCFCYARYGGYSRITCALYSIDYSYWSKAGSPVVNVDDEPESKASYKKCMKNENCILATLDQYAEAIGHMDCNCDGEFDCKDRFAIHLFGSKCSNPKFSKRYAKRFNSCSGDLGVSPMEASEGREGCEAEVYAEAV